MIHLSWGKYIIVGKMSRLQKLSVICSVIFVLLHALFRSSPIAEQILISHRGAAGLAPENSIASVQKAIEHDVSYIEVDVQRTYDQVLVLLHDYTIDRTTNGTGEIDSLSWEAAQSDSVEYPIPKLQEVLQLVEPTGASLVLELKNPHKYPGIERQLVHLVNEYHMNDRVTIVSFDIEAVQKVSQINKNLELGHLYAQGIYMPQVEETSIIDVHWLVPIVDPTFLWRHHRCKRRVWVWTVDSPAMMKLLLWLGVDGITTNYPQRWPKK